MFWYVLLGVVAGLSAITLLLPTTRRIWVFWLYAFKYIGLWLLDLVRLRRLYLRALGRPSPPLTRPVLLRLLAEDLGPTFIKFGQIVASSSGMFPERYSVEFQKCLDRVRPFPFARVREILREELGAEKAGQLVDIDPEPLASASIAQVHTAELGDGTRVVIKVQRPGIEGRVAADMRILRAAAVVLTKLSRDAQLVNPVGIVEDFAETLREELDFNKEAANQDRFNQIMAELGHKEIRAPVPQWAMTTRRVLVMERFFGIRVDFADEILARGIDAEDALVRGLRAWFQCVVFYGFFHGDVHAGNLMLLDNGDLGFLDFGIVGRFDDRQRYLVTDYMMAFAGGNFRKLAEVIVEMGGMPEGDVDMDAFVEDLEEAYGPLLKKSFAEINYAEMLPVIQRVASKNRMFMPKEFVLITKQMLYFDRYAKLLAPELNVFTDPRLLMSFMADIAKARSEHDKAARAAGEAST